MKRWWIVNIFWIVIFAVTAILIGVRDVDGAGVPQTTQTKLVTLLILAVMFIIIVFCRILALHFAKKHK